MSSNAYMANLKQVIEAQRNENANSAASFQAALMTMSEELAATKKELEQVRERQQDQAKETATMQEALLTRSKELAEMRDRFGQRLDDRQYR